MHTLAEVMEIVEDVAGNSGKAAQQALAAHTHSQTVREVLEYAYDPFRTYGIKKLPEAEMAADDSAFMEWSEVKAVLDRLAARELTGNAARGEVGAMLGNLAPDAEELVRRVLLKDLRFGLSAKSINKVVPGLIPQFEPMLAHPFEVKRVKAWPVAVEPKLDGVRVLAVVDMEQGTVEFLSRSGKTFTAFDHLRKDVVRVARAWAGGPGEGHVVLDGEMISGSFLETVSSVRRKEQAAEDAVYNVFDILAGHEFFREGKSSQPYEQRRAYLVEVFSEMEPVEGVCLVDSTHAHSHEEIEQRVREIWDQGGEGVLVKPLDGHYECKRSHRWLKIKAEESVDVPVIGTYEGTGKNEGKLGGIIVELDGNPVHVGGGFSDGQREALWHSRDAVPGRLAEIEFHERTPDGSLRHPRFNRFRDYQGAKV